MTHITPKTRIRQAAEEDSPLDETPIPWDELSVGSRQYLEDIRASLREMREGKVHDAKSTIAELREELEADA